MNLALSIFAKRYSKERDRLQRAQEVLLDVFYILDTRQSRSSLQHRHTCETKPHLRPPDPSTTDTMGRAEAGSTKAISNQLKSKGLTRLRWYCQVCEKACRDANAFKYVLNPSRSFSPPGYSRC